MQQLKKLRQLNLFHKGDLLIAFVAIVLLIVFVPIFTYYYFSRDLITKETIMNRNNTGMVLLDRHGQVFFRFYEGQFRNFVSLDQIPKHTQEAVLASEDREFYSHPGFSVRAIGAAVIADIKHGKLAYGGSTITQQLVKNSLLNSNKNFLRKYQELVLAQEIERRFSKQEILEMYLNSVYFGHGAFGIESAAKTYFGKTAKELNLAESSILAGLLTAPSSLNPINGDQEKIKTRQEYVLQQMVEQKYIQAKDKDEALKTEIKIADQKDRNMYKAPHFAIMVRDELVQKYGEETVTRGGLEVHTTLDLGWQEYAEDVVAKQVENLKRNKVSNGAAVVIDPKTGEVRVLVGSKDWYDEKFGKFNITTALRQPGSSFKPIVYAAALEKRLITPATVLKDEPITYNQKGSPPYKPQNYDRKFRGPVLVRRALVNSLNVPAIETLMKVGIPSVIETSQRLGINSLKQPSDYGPSFALGTGEVRLVELTNAYATLANQGQRNNLTLITKIIDKRNQTIFEYKPEPKAVISPEVSFQIASILADNPVRAEVFGNTLNISRQAAVKTGTTDDYKDALTLGFTPQLAVGVWVGNNDNVPMDQIAGSLGAAPIWKSLMEKFHQGQPEIKFSPPLGLAAKSICRSNGLLVKEATSSGYTEYFLKGTEPTRPCAVAVTNPSPNPNNTAPPTTQPTVIVVPNQVPTPEPGKDRRKDKKDN